MPDGGAPGIEVGMNIAPHETTPSDSGQFDDRLMGNDSGNYVVPSGDEGNAEPLIGGMSQTHTPLSAGDSDLRDAILKSFMRQQPSTEIVHEPQTERSGKQGKLSHFFEKHPLISKIAKFGAFPLVVLLMALTKGFKSEK